MLGETPGEYAIMLRPEELSTGSYQDAPFRSTESGSCRGTPSGVPQPTLRNMRLQRRLAMDQRLKAGP
jgi:hypothetical protein